MPSGMQVRLNARGGGGEEAFLAVEKFCESNLQLLKLLVRSKATSFALAKCGVLNLIT